MRRNNGFTLLEIMIAVAIVAIMIAAVSPTIKKYIANAKLRQAEAELEEVAAAMLAATGDHPDWDKDMDRLFRIRIYIQGYIDKDPLSLGISYSGTGLINEGELIKVVPGAGTVRRKI